MYNDPPRARNSNRDLNTLCKLTYIHTYNIEHREPTHTNTRKQREMRVHLYRHTDVCK